MVEDSQSRRLKIASKRVIEKTAEATGELDGKKTVEKFTKAASTREDPITHLILRKYLRKKTYHQKHDKKKKKKNINKLRLL